MTIPSIKDADIRDKKVLVRVDYNVSLKESGKIADDARITQTLPTLKFLLQNNNKLILIAHLGQPEQRDPKYSLLPVAADLQKYLPDQKVTLINDFLSE